MDIFDLIAYTGWEFPLPSLLILKPRPDEQDWGYYQYLLRICAYINQDGQCICGEQLSNPSELHHALISRKDVMSHPQPHLIHSVFNVILLHPGCHQNITREESFRFLSRIYGDQVLDWYTPFRFIRRIEHVSKRRIE